MKSLILVSVAAVVYLGAITAIFRFTRTHRKIVLMVRVFLLTLVFFVGVHVLTPANLGVLPPALTEPSRWLDLGFGVFVYSAVFFGGILQLYNLADRGFSLRMLIDIAESPDQALAVGEMLAAYSRGRGLDWMLQKRIDGLLDRKMILLVDGRVRITASGRRVASLYAPLRVFMRLAPAEKGR